MIDVSNKGVLRIVSIRNIYIRSNHSLIGWQKRMAVHALTSRNDLLNISRLPLSFHDMNFPNVFNINPFNGCFRQTEQRNDIAVNIVRLIENRNNTRSFFGRNHSVYKREYDFIFISLISRCYERFPYYLIRRRRLSSTVLREQNSTLFNEL